MAPTGWQFGPSRHHICAAPARIGASFICPRARLICRTDLKNRDMNAEPQGPIQPRKIHILGREFSMPRSRALRIAIGVAAYLLRYLRLPADPRLLDGAARPAGALLRIRGGPPLAPPHGGLVGKAQEKRLVTLQAIRSGSLERGQRPRDIRPRPCLEALRERVGVEDALAGEEFLQQRHARRARLHPRPSHIRAGPPPHRHRTPSGLRRESPDPCPGNAPRPAAPARRRGRAGRAWQSPRSSPRCSEAASVRRGLRGFLEPTPRS